MPEALTGTADQPSILACSEAGHLRRDHGHGVS
jgi:hypothetical protein